MISQHTQDAAWRTTVLVKGAETLSIMAAALLIFIIISARSQDAILTLLGVMIIAAIIIPTQDIARIASMVGIGEVASTDSSPRSARGTFVDYALSDRVARRAVAEMLANSEVGGILRDGLLRAEDRAGAAGPRVTAQEERRSAVDPRVVTTDQQRRNQDLLERRLAVLLYNNDLDFLEGAVRQRGLDRILLDTLSRDRMQQLALLPANARRAREELSALRDLGLVSMSQFDIISVQSTRLGQQVLCGIYPEHPDVIQSIAQQQRLVGRDALERCLRLTPAAEAAAAPSPQSRSREGFTIRPEMQQPLRQSFTLTDARGLSIPIVVPLETGRIWLRIETSSASPGFDPVLELRQEGIADPLANDDDSAGGRNARLDFEFAAGNYDLRLLRWGGGLGGATITVTRLTPAQVSALRPMDASEISLDGFAAPVPVPDAQLGGGLPIPVQIPADGTLLSFRLAEAQALVFDLAVVGIADLEMSLYRQNGRNLSFLLYNDDRPVTNGASDRQRLDPLIAMALEGGEYILRIRELSRRPVDATLRISRRTPEPPAQHAPTPTSPTLAPIQPSAPQIRR